MYRLYLCPYAKDQPTELFFVQTTKAGGPIKGEGTNGAFNYIQMTVQVQTNN